MRDRACSLPRRPIAGCPWRLKLLVGAVTVGGLGGVSLGSVSASVPEADALRAAAQTVEWVVLRSGWGVPWTPSASMERRLERALGRPWKRQRPLSAPYARSDEEVVSAAVLAWAVLAEIAQAQRLDAQGDPAALVYLYLASRHVGFAQEALWDETTGLYLPRWDPRTGAQGDPRLDDQMLWLWALSVYSTVGGLLSLQEGPGAQVFQRQAGRLADRLFRSLVPLWNAPSQGEKSSGEALLLQGAALTAYVRAGRVEAREGEKIRAALLPRLPQPEEILTQALRPWGDVLRLRELAQRAVTLQAALVVFRDRDRDADRRRVEAALRDALRRLLGAPAARALLRTVPWPSQVVRAAGQGPEEWRPAPPEASERSDVEASLALAYSLLAAFPPNGRREPPPEAQPESPLQGLERVAQALRQAEEEVHRLRLQAATLLAERDEDRPAPPAFLPTEAEGTAGRPTREPEAVGSLGIDRTGTGAWWMGVGGILLLGAALAVWGWRAMRG